MTEDRYPDGLAPHQAAAEAGRCLFCHDAPCVKGCPAGVDVPAFVRKIVSGNWRGAARVIGEANVFGGVCAWVCPTEELCEGACSSRLLGRAVPIGALQAVAWERGRAAWLAGIRAAEPPETGPGCKAAIVGGGPAGLAAAWELVTRGWDVTIHEAGDRLGGQLDLTIPAYRLPCHVVEEDIGAIARAGVEFQTGVRVDRKKARSLLRDNDVVILATGLGPGRRAGVPGEDLPGVIAAEEYLAGAREVARSGSQPYAFLPGSPPGRVVVVGGGNTAMDAAVTAVRSGAKRVTVIYRRTANEMPAWPREYQGAVAAGVEFLWLVQPVSFEREEERGEARGEAAAVESRQVTRVRRVRCVRMALGEPDASGRAAPRPVPGSEFTLEADLVLLALGQGPNTEIIEAFGLAAGPSGRSVVDGLGRAVPIGDLAEGERRAAVYVAGDLANGGATVVQAVAEGRRAALAAVGELAKPEAAGASERDHGPSFGAAGFAKGGRA